MVICIRIIESEAWVICLVKSFGLESRLVYTKVWDARGGSEEGVCYTDSVSDPYPDASLEKNEPPVWSALQPALAPPTSADSLCCRFTRV